MGGWSRHPRGSSRRPLFFSRHITRRLTGFSARGRGSASTIEEAMSGDQFENVSETSALTGPVSRTDLIRAINDRCRARFLGCVVVVTAAFDALPAELKAKVLSTVRTFQDFDGGNDPYHEHDFAALTVDGQAFMFKFDYYAPDMRHGSDDPSDVEKTRRVLTIMLASDY
jgi:Protein of unknown function (DUF3768)